MSQTNGSQPAPLSREERIARAAAMVPGAKKPRTRFTVVLDDGSALKCRVNGYHGRNTAKVIALLSAPNAVAEVSEGKADDGSGTGAGFVKVVAAELSLADGLKVAQSYTAEEVKELLTVAPVENHGPPAPVVS